MNIVLLSGVGKSLCNISFLLKVKAPIRLSHLAQFSGWPKPEALSRWNLVASLILVLNMNQDIVVKSKIQLCLKKIVVGDQFT